MPNVLQLFSTTSPDDVSKSYLKIFGRDLNVSFYHEFLDSIKTKVLIKSNAYVDIDFFEEKYEDPKHDTAHYDVTWFKDTTYSMSFVPWGEILTAEVRDNSGRLTVPEQCAVIFDEMTEQGLEEDAVDLRDEILDRVEEVKHAFEKTAEEDNDTPAPRSAEGFTSLDDFLEEVKSEMSPEKRKEYNTFLEMHLNRKSFKNGEPCDGIRCLPVYSPV